jgi:catechol 2,3-dioxygenase-like lactoylglutathione lyase family enzyme
MSIAGTGPSSGVAFRSNCEVAIQVPDLQRAETFYRDVLGFTLVNKRADQLEFDTGVLRLYVNRDAQQVFSFIPSLDVDDYKAARQHLEAAGCATVRVNADSESVYFKDPFGLVFDIIERR